MINDEEIKELQSLTNKIEQTNEGKQYSKPVNEKLQNEESNKIEEVEELKNETFQETIEDFILEDLQIKEPEPEEVKNDETKIYYLALGDSLTKGVGDEEQKNGYTKRLAEKIEKWTDISEVVIDNRGKRGRRSDQLLALLEKGHYDEELINSELITLTIGGNDIMKIVKKDLLNLKRGAFDKELVQFEERYEKIINEIRLRNPEVPIVLIGLYNPFSMITDEITEFESIIEEWNETMKKISEKHENACFVDVEDLFNANSDMVYHTDFFHPNGYGYTIITERIVSMMKACEIEEDSKGLILFN